MEIANNPVPPMTFEQVMAILDKKYQETLAKLEAEKAETLAKIEADKKLHAEQMKKQHQDTLAKIEADKKLQQEQMREFKEEMKRHHEEMKNLSRRFGDLSNRFGEIVEGMVSPNLKSKFREYGFNFGNSTTNYVISDGKQTITEVDVLLEDGDCVMVVEVKTKPVTDDITKHIERLENIKRFPPGAARGKKVYGAIACAIINDDVKSIVFNEGFYLICQTGDTVDIVTPPPSFVHRYWEC
jgi:hypothetical protein